VTGNNGPSEKWQKLNKKIPSNMEFKAKLVCDNKYRSEIWWLYGYGDFPPM
jgi:hypothetical protein